MWVGVGVVNAENVKKESAKSAQRLKEKIQHTQKVCVCARVLACERERVRVCLLACVCVCVSRAEARSWRGTETDTAIETGDRAKNRRCMTSCERACVCV